MKTIEKIKNSKITEITGILEKHVYKYFNGKYAFFINNKKIILSDEIKILYLKISKEVERIVFSKKNCKIEIETWISCKIEIETWVSSAIEIVRTEDKKNDVNRPPSFEDKNNVDKKYQPYCELREIFEKKLFSEIKNILYDEYDIDIEDLKIA